MISGYVIAFGITLLSFAIFPTGACSQAEGSKVVILLRLAGDNGTLPPLRSCLTSRLSTMPDTEVAVAPTDGDRFVVEAVFASLVVAETFPLEQFRPRFKEGEDGNALLTSVRYYTLLRLHEFLFGRSPQALCARIATDITDRVLSEEYTERND